MPPTPARLAGQAHPGASHDMQKPGLAKLPGTVSPGAASGDRRSATDQPPRAVGDGGEGQRRSAPKRRPHPNTTENQHPRGTKDLGATWIRPSRAGALPTPSANGELCDMWAPLNRNPTHRAFETPKDCQTHTLAADTSDRREAGGRWWE